MTLRDAAILQYAHAYWPMFTRHATEIGLEYQRQRGIFDNFADLRIAYATVIGRRYPGMYDWRKNAAQ